MLHPRWGRSLILLTQSFGQYCLHALRMQLNVEVSEQYTLMGCLVKGEESGYAQKPTKCYSSPLASCVMFTAPVSRISLLLKKIQNICLSTIVCNGNVQYSWLDALIGNIASFYSCQTALGTLWEALIYFLPGILVCCGAYVVTRGSLCASRALHRQMLDSVLHLPLQYFETNPVGQIINRFTKVRRNVFPSSSGKKKEVVVSHL